MFYFLLIICDVLGMLYNVNKINYNFDDVLCNHCPLIGGKIELHSALPLSYPVGPDLTASWSCLNKMALFSVVG